jgi:purine-binding chemotaxis protein CheW
MDGTYAKKNGDAAHAAPSKKFVTFMISQETFGVEALNVQEIIGMTRITEIPNAPPFMKGVINLRGMVVPVIDMRLKFSMERREYDFFTVIIIVEMREILVGMIVDTVSDVIDLEDTDISDAAALSADVDSRYIRGIANKNDEMIILLDTDRVMSGSELNALELAGAQA